MNDMKNHTSSRGSKTLLDLVANYSAFRPDYVPMLFESLKPSTRYKVFIKTNDENSHEDITMFCRPNGETRKYNTNTTSFDSFVTSPYGILELEIRPFGTDSIDSSRDWSNFWRYFGSQSIFSNTGRSNVFVMPTADVTGVAGRYYSINKEFDSTFFPVTSSSTDDKYVAQPFQADYIQTFFIDPNLIDNDKTVDVVSIGLYFRKKPKRTGNRSNKVDPGMIVSIIDVEGGVPVTNRQYYNSIAYCPWGAVNVSENAEIMTEITFPDTVRLEAGKQYAFAVMFDDPDYDIWRNVDGHMLAGSQSISSGSKGEHKGDLYTVTNSKNVVVNSSFETQYSKQNKTQLKFDLFCNKYDLNEPLTIDLINQAFEYIKVTPTSGNFAGGEFVYQRSVAPLTTVTAKAGDSVIHCDTDISGTINVGDALVIEADGVYGTPGYRPPQIVSVTHINATVLSISSYLLHDVATSANIHKAVVGRVSYFNPYTRELHLTDSNATTLNRFLVGETLHCTESDNSCTIDEFVEIPVNLFRLNAYIDSPSDFKIDFRRDLVRKDINGKYINIDPGLWAEMSDTRPNYINEAECFLISRSVELSGDHPDLYKNGDDPKSAVVRMTMQSDEPRVAFESPEIAVGGITLLTHKWNINNDATNEHLNVGNALSRHISNTLNLDPGRNAEDIRVIVNAYRPPGTDFKVYAKIINAADPEPFDDKHWSELEVRSGANQISDPQNFSDFHEFELGFPSNIESTEVPVSIVFSDPGSGNDLGDKIQGVGLQTHLNNGDIVKIYDPLFPDMFGVFVVMDDTLADNKVQLSESVSGDVFSNLLAEGLRVAKVNDNKLQTAFNYHINDNVVRYYSSDKSVYDTYSSVAIKIVLLSESVSVVPKIDDYRVIAVTV